MMNQVIHLQVFRKVKKHLQTVSFNKLWIYDLYAQIN